MKTLFLASLLLPVTGASPLVHASEILTLDDGIDIALKESLVVRSARESTVISETQKKEAFTGFLTKFSAAYSYTMLSEGPSFYFPGFPPFIPATQMITGTGDNYIWSLEIRKPIFAGGAIMEGYRASVIAMDVSALEEKALTLDIIDQAREAYFTTDVPDAQTLVTKAGTDYAVSRANYNISRARLERTMGGLQ